MLLASEPSRPSSTVSHVSFTGHRTQGGGQSLLQGSSTANREEEADQGHTITSLTPNQASAFSPHSCAPALASFIDSIPQEENKAALRLAEVKPEADMIQPGLPTSTILTLK